MATKRSSLTTQKRVVSSPFNIMNNSLILTADGARHNKTS